MEPNDFQLLTNRLSLLGLDDVFGGYAPDCIIIYFQDMQGRREPEPMLHENYQVDRYEDDVACRRVGTVRVSRKKIVFKLRFEILCRYHPSARDISKVQLDELMWTLRWRMKRYIVISPDGLDVSAYEGAVMKSIVSR